MDPLADPQDLADRLEILEFTQAQSNRAAAIIRDASALVRNYTRQDFTLGTDTAILEPTGEQWLYLPQRPVISVDTVMTYGALLGAGYWALKNDALYRQDGWSNVYFGTSGPWNRPDTIDVTYTHGYPAGDIPDDIVSIVCKLAQATWINPQGLRQFTEGNMSATLAIETVGAGCLDEGDMRVLRAYRRPNRSIKFAGRLL